MKTWAVAMMVAAGLLAGSRSLAGERVYLETGDRNPQTGAVRISLCLETVRPLACFSVTLSVSGGSVDLAAAKPILNDRRLPWADRAVTAETKDNRLTFCVVDLSGENTMVNAGAGWVFALDLPQAAGAAAPALRVEEVRAFDPNGNPVRLSGGSGQEPN